MPAQFDANGQASIELNFTGRRLHVTYHNPQRLDVGAYRIHRLQIKGQELAGISGASVTLPRAAILDCIGKVVQIDIYLSS